MKIFEEYGFCKWSKWEKFKYLLNVYFEWYYERRNSYSWQWFWRTPLFMIGASHNFPMRAYYRISDSLTVALFPNIPFTEGGHLYKYVFEQNWNQQTYKTKELDIQ